MKKEIKQKLERILELVHNHGYDSGVNYCCLETMSKEEALIEIEKIIDNKNKQK